MEKPASTKEVLGEHLHQKVKEVQNGHGGDIELIGKITGILLERSVQDIYKMLTDETFLQNCVSIAMKCVQDTSKAVEDGDKQEDHKVSKKDDLNSSSSQVSQDREYSEEEINEQLYEKINQLDTRFAPQITGMLLELDKETRINLLHNESMFTAAFKKAKDYLLTSDASSSQIEVVDETDDFSLEIYERAEKLYKDFAPKITGMILELDQETLRQIVRDQTYLDAAILKAFNAVKDDLNS